MSAHKASVQKQLDEHRKQQHHNYRFVPQKGGRRGKHMLAAAQAQGADPSPAPKRNVFEQVIEKSAKGSGTEPSAYPEKDLALCNRVCNRVPLQQVYALCNRVCARFHACATEPRFVFDGTPPHRLFEGMVFFVETQRTDAHHSTICDINTYGGEVIVGAYDASRVTHLIGEFILIRSWAFRLTSCFVYSRR
jgi:hypothetical protein